MTLSGFIAVILIAFIIGATFYFILKTAGPWGSFWTFFIVVFLGVFIAYVWVRPIGPVLWGITLFPLFFIGLLFALLLAAATPPRRGSRYNRKDHPADTPVGPGEATPEDEAIELGIFFWTALILFIALLIAGLYY